MKRKIISLLLCALLLAGITIGCAKKSTPKEAFFEIAASLDDLTEGNFTVSLGMKLPADAIGDSAAGGFLGDISDFKLDIAGSFSQKNEQMTAEILATFGGSQGKEAPLKITDILYDKSGLYLNLRTIFDLLGSIQGGGLGFDYSSLFSSDYLGITLEDIAEFSGMAGIEAPTFDKDSLLKNKELGDHLSAILTESLKAESFSADDGLYTLTLKTADLVDMIKGLVSDIEANTGMYADALLELEAQNPGYLASIGLQADNRDELIALIKTEVAGLSSNIEDAAAEEMPDLTLLISIGKGKAAKSFDMRVSLTAPEEELDIKTDITLTGVFIEKVTPPADHLKLSDLLSLFLM